MRSLRGSISAEQKRQWDHCICTVLQQIVVERSVASVHTFLPISSEVNIYPFIAQLLNWGIEVVCPESLAGGNMRNLVLHSLSELKTGIFGTRYPSSGELYTGRYDLIVVPGLAFDHTKHRLGYGAGYYDIFLGVQPDACKVGVAYPFQLVEQLPVEPHDVPMDQVILGTTTC